MTYENNAFEMGLERLVDFGLADDASISIAALRRIKAAGVDRRRSSASRSTATRFPALNNMKWPARRQDGGDVGKVTSAIYSPRLRAQHRFCWVPAALAARAPS